MKKVSLFKPMLDNVKIDLNNPIDFNVYPFCLSLIKNLKSIQFTTPVTFIIGENGTGKSTILEAIAHKIGFGSEGGSINIHFKTAGEKTYEGIQSLANILTLCWNNKPKNGYFFRAESFFNLANYIDSLANEGGEGPDRAYQPYGGKSLHEQSHGESFLSFFTHRMKNGGFFILDEPEAALSPQRQLSLLNIINTLCNTTNSQFIIATHSPIILAYPNSMIYSCDTGSLTPIAYKDSVHYKITKQFLENPDLFLKHLFDN